jgi:hypothetical protein
MTLDAKGVVDRGLDIQEALRRTWRFEALLFAPSPSDRLVAVLRTLIGNEFGRLAEGSKFSIVGSEFRGCDPSWRPFLFLRPFPHQFHRCLGVPL